MKNLTAVFTPQVRAYVYRVLIALGAVAVFYGWVTQEAVTVLAGALAVLFNIMPTVNTSTKK